MWSEEDNVITRASYSNTGCSVLYKNHRKLSVAGLLQFMLGIIILSLGISISKFFLYLRVTSMLETRSPRPFLLIIKPPTSLSYSCIDYLKHVYGLDISNKSAVITKK